MERDLCTVRKCFVYQIPPLKNAKGHRASDWNVDQPIWTGALKLTTKDSDTISLWLVDNSGELFACSPVASRSSIEPVLDSSRYFAIQLVDSQSGSKSIVGLGFEKSADAFDLLAGVQDHFNKMEKKVDIIEYDFRPKQVSNIPVPNVKETVDDDDEFGDFHGTDN